MAEFVTGQLVFSKQDNAEGVIAALMGEWATVVTNSDRNTRHISTLTPLEPKVGDRVRIVEVADYDGNPRLRVGDEVTLSAHDVSERFPHEWGSGEKNGPFLLISGGKSQSTYCRVILLRRASQPAEVKEADRLFKGDCCTFCGARGNDVVHYIGHKSDPRPYNVCRYPKHADEPWWGSCGKEYERRKSLQPAPTSAGEAVAAGWEVGRAYEWARHNETLRGTLVYKSVDARGTQCLYFNRDDGVTGIGDNRTWLVVVKECSRIVPISPPPAGSALNGDAQASASEPVGGGSLKPDPYAEHREKEEAGRPPVNAQWAHHDRMRALAYLDHEDDALDRLAASRRKLAQTKQAMDRPAVERHPAPSSMASSRGVVFGPLGEKQFHRSARRYWKRDEGHPVTWPEGSCDDV